MKIKPKQYAQAFFESLIANPGQEKKLAASFAALLIKNDQIASLTAILECLEALRRKRQGIVVAEIVSARQLSPGILAELEDFIVARVAGKQIEVTERVDKKLIGGAVLRYDGRLLDLSLKDKINKLKSDLVG